jgi:hypothetical protein
MMLNDQAAKRQLSVALERAKNLGIKRERITEVLAMSKRK